MNEPDVGLANVDDAVAARPALDPIAMKRLQQAQNRRGALEFLCGDNQQQNVDDLFLLRTALGPEIKLMGETSAKNGPSNDVRASEMRSRMGAEHSAWWTSTDQLFLGAQFSNASGPCCIKCVMTPSL